MRALIMAMVVYIGTQATGCADPQARCSRAPAGWLENGEDAAHHRIIVSAMIRRDGAILWQGSTISEGQLIANLQRTQDFNPLPYLILQYERGLNCEQLMHFRDIFNANANCNRGGICSERVAP